MGLLNLLKLGGNSWILTLFGRDVSDVHISAGELFKSESWLGFRLSPLVDRLTSESGLLTLFRDLALAGFRIHI